MWVCPGFLGKYCLLLTAASLRISQQGGSGETVKPEESSSTRQPLRATPSSCSCTHQDVREDLSLTAEAVQSLGRVKALALCL